MLIKKINQIIETIKETILKIKENSNKSKLRAKKQTNVIGWENNNKNDNIQKEILFFNKNKLNLTIE